ncbi:hypothetical protein, partial [Porphyromonas loveana]|uniref:hypothetical protein n=1 Tax=Porphyromonas loveana TaxID=1884669 RepID=UPI00359FAC1B
MIQQELWIAQLATASDTDVSTSDELWSHYCRLTGQLLSKGETIRQEGIGLWQAVKEDEYVGIRPDGSRVLVPPRIKLCLIGPVSSPTRETMLQALIDLTPYTEVVVARWWKAIPEVLSALLQKGHSVSWPQFGRFEPIKEEEVLVGCRFIAEGELSELLNRPFSMFPTIELSPETEIADTQTRPLEAASTYFISFRTEHKKEENKPEPTPITTEKEIPIAPLPTAEKEAPTTEANSEDEETRPKEEAQPTDAAVASTVSSVPKEEKKRFTATHKLLWFAATLIIGIATAFLLQRLPVLSKKATQQPQESVVPAPRDTTPIAVDTVQAVPAPTDLGRIVMRKGDMLTRIARETYGDR